MANWREANWRKTFWAMGLAVLVAGMARAGNGDVDRDGRVTRADADLALRIAGGLLKATSTQAMAADTVTDGAVTIADAVRIMRIALGTDTTTPTGAIPTTLSLTVSGSGFTQNIDLAGGYNVTGTVKDTAGNFVAGSVVFRNTGTQVNYRATLDDFGNYSINLPAGTYQPVVVTTTQTQTTTGENITIDQAVAAGSTVMIGANRTGLNLTRPNLAASTNVTFNILQPADGRAFFPTSITLTDRGTTATTYGLNHVVRDTSATPAPTTVPPGSYTPNLYGSLVTGVSSMTDFRLIDQNALNEPGTSTRNLTVPATFILNGTLAGASAAYAQEVTVETAPGYTGTQATTHTTVSDSAYTMNVVPGSRIVGVAMVNPSYTETTVHWRFAFTMPSRDTALTTTLPALPAFRTITGVVYDPNGTTVPGATIVVTQTPISTPSTGYFVVSAIVATDTTGAFTLDLPDGTYTLNVSLP